MIVAVSCRTLVRLGGRNGRMPSFLITAASGSWSEGKGNQSSTSAPLPPKASSPFGSFSSQPPRSMPAAAAEAAKAVIQPEASAGLQLLLDKHKGRLVRMTLPCYPNCEVYLCGTLHVSHFSGEMVREVLRALRPDWVMLELCEGRVDSLLEEEADGSSSSRVPVLSIREIARGAWSARSVKALCMGLLCWLQGTAATFTDSKLGGELAIACREAHMCGATVVLGDRQYAVTIQRIFDKLSAWEKAKFMAILCWESVTISVRKISEYVQQSQAGDDGFIADEIEQFAAQLPSLAQVIVSERDEYLAQTLHEMASIMDHDSRHAAHDGSSNRSKGIIVAVVGAGHLPGIQRHLLVGGLPLERILEISSSSKQPPTWPGRGMLSIVDASALYRKQPDVLTR